MTDAGPLSEIGRILLMLALAAPLAMIALVPLVRQPLRLLPWAAAPGLAAAVLAPSGTAIEVSALLLGLHLELDRIGAVFLGFGSLVWLLAGVYSSGYLAASERASSFAVFWLLTLAGSLGTFVAADVVTFYAAFSVMSLATYGLVIHDRTASARRAGLIYICLAVLGESVLVATFMLAASNADSLLLTDIRAALAASPVADEVLLGLLVGFGIKVGLVPLHVWLPLAHPEAPTPASAVLSGVIVKAGVIGLIRLLPGDALSPAWSDALITAGLVTSYFGIAIGLLQSNAKAILAYSTLSQMGIVVTILASGLGLPDSSRALEAAALYASHHGLAKGALFLAVGLVVATGTQARPWILAVTAATALAIAGLPLSGGALAKLAAKGSLSGGAAAVLVTASAIGTALLMLRFLWVLRRYRHDLGQSPAWRLLLPWAGLVVAAFGLPWALFSGFAGYSVRSALAPEALWAALWPVLVALMVAALVVWRRWSAPWAIPPGDIVVLGEALARHGGADRTWMSARIADFAHRHSLALSLSLAGVEGVERALLRWTVSGPAVVFVAVLIGLALSI